MKTVALVTLLFTFRTTNVVNELVYAPGPENVNILLLDPVKVIPFLLLNEVELKVGLFPVPVNVAFRPYPDLSFHCVTPDPDVVNVEVSDASNQTAKDDGKLPASPIKTAPFVKSYGMLVEYPFPELTFIDLLNLPVLVDI
mgnify:CR=1 FL=1